ncbi:TIGR03773 family transporter-associated surface protein [Micrococcus luteus]|uniref:TIGR03773 family transporter-associated surface protein n=1 Tax=Micrococcus luteus TaxID=1270 RepID=UPI002103EF95|nr:TIGR03773 family transporter-associated surface protein [Micrococcus luteus]UTX34026.1 TIGR03773 family transporter-associated surface protein [Micrococcus luteus]
MPLANPSRPRPSARRPRPARVPRLAAAGAAAALLAGVVVVTPAPGGGALLAPEASAACQVAGEQVSSGHFDVGPALSGGSLAPRVKDDRTSPARWRSPGEVVFALGDAAAVRLPAGLGFIGPEGTPVHMIGGVQQAGVPWLGWNTQDPGLLESATGPVTMSLQGVSGPGEVAVFTSGTFGTAVGQRIMDTVGGPRSTTVPLNTHAHGNWVFTAPGVYRVSLAFSVPTDAGTRSGSTTLTFAVGGCSAPAAAAPAAPRGNAQQPAARPAASAPAPQRAASRPATGPSAAPAQGAAPAGAGAQARPATGAAQAPAGAPAVAVPTRAAERRGTAAPASGAARADDAASRPGAWPGTVATGSAPAAPAAGGAAPENAAGSDADPQGLITTDPQVAALAPGQAGADQTVAGSGGLRVLGPDEDPAALAAAVAPAGPHWPSLAIGAGAVLVLFGFGAGVYRLARTR